MSDDGFDFRRAPERREAKQFEPPPWEREAFDELQRRRPDQDEPEVQQPADGSEQAAESSRTTPESTAPACSAEQGVEKSKPNGGVDEAQILEFLAGLAAEEPPAARTYFGVAMGTALFLIALGAVLLIWGVAALAGARRTGAVGTFAGTALGLFGAGFLGAGIWMAYQALKRRGVL